MLALMKNNYYKLVSNRGTFIVITLVYCSLIVFYKGSGLNTKNFVLFMPIFALTVQGLKCIEFVGVKNFEKQIICLPVSKRKIIKSIYYFQTIIAIFIGFVLFVALSLNFIYNGYDFKNFFPNYSLFVAVPFSFSVVFASIYLPLSYKVIGNFKIFTMMIAGSISYGLFSFILDLIKESYSYATPMEVMAISFVIIIISFFVYIISYFITAGIFERNDLANMVEYVED